jgi:type II secretory pathway pseudopilin PulG
MRGKTFYSGRDSQIAVEFILIVGIVLLIVVAVTPTIMKQQELNKALSAARDGAAFGSSMRGMGFAGEGVNELPEGIVKIERIALEEQPPEDGKTWYRIRFYISAPNYMKDNSVCSSSSIGMTVRKRSVSYINYAFYGSWTPDDELKVNTTNFKFTTACDFI